MAVLLSPVKGLLSRIYLLTNLNLEQSEQELTTLMFVEVLYLQKEASRKCKMALVNVINKGQQLCLPPTGKLPYYNVTVSLAATRWKIQNEVITRTRKIKKFI